MVVICIFGGGILVFICCLQVGQNFNITPSNASYIVLGLAILLVSYLYRLCNIKCKDKRFREYCKYEASPEVPDDSFIRWTGVPGLRE